MATLADVNTALGNLNVSVGQAVTLLNTLHGQASDPAALQAIADGINGAKQQLDAAIVANPPLGS